MWWASPDSRACDEQRPGTSPHRDPGSFSCRLHPASKKRRATEVQAFVTRTLLVLKRPYVHYDVRRLDPEDTDDTIVDCSGLQDKKAPYRQRLDEVKSLPHKINFGPHEPPFRAL